MNEIHEYASDVSIRFAKVERLHRRYQDVLKKHGRLQDRFDATHQPELDMARNELIEAIQTLEAWVSMKLTKMCQPHGLTGCAVCAKSHRDQSAATEA